MVILSGFKRVTIYECRSCGKRYTSQPHSCGCNGKLVEGSIVGAFKIVSKETRDEWKVVCRLCDMITVMHRTNVRRAHSCGCKPNHVRVILVGTNHVKYKCNRCKSIINTTYPIINWCCQ